MWQITPIIISAISTIIVAREIRKSQDPALSFLIFAVYSRYLLSAFPEFTIQPIFAGLSLNALSATFTVLVGIIMLQRKYFLVSALIPLYVFIGFLLFSGAMNIQISGTLTAATRYAYVVSLQIALFVALRKLGPERVFGPLLTVFILPVCLQIASIFLRHRVGASGANDEVRDNLGISYIGSYDHEASFSVILLAMLVVAMFWRDRNPMQYWMVVMAGVVGLVFANYRTTLLSAVPIILAIAIARYYSTFLRGQRAFAISAALIIGIPTVYVAIASTPALIERFQNLGDLTSFDFSMKPNEFTQTDRRILSSRIFLWSKYIDAVQDSGLANQLIGHGPESWKGRFPVYAHNNFISYLYEFGFIGLSIFIFYCISNLYQCFKITNSVTFLKLFSGYLGFGILCMATMPLWKIEGNIVLALLNGVLFYEVSKFSRTSETLKLTGHRVRPTHALNRGLGAVKHKGPT